MANKTVVRNEAYKRGGLSIRQRHNERENESYSNADIRLDRSPMNVHFRKCGGTYTEEFDKLTDKMKYYQAMQRAPNRLAEAVADIMRQTPENAKLQPNLHREKSRDNGIYK